MSASRDIIEVPDKATLKSQELDGQIYTITGETVITHLQRAYRGQFSIQDHTGAILVDDPAGAIETNSGDANCDGAVNVLDIITIANYFVGNEPDPFCFENADVNGDGLINVLDLVLTVEIFQGGDSGNGTVTDIDGNVYQTVIIGNQEWMAENLRVTRDADGNDITRYCYNADPTNCDLYGGLYTWHTLMNGATTSNTNPGNVHGICPAGWHVPSHAEWTQLEQYICNQLGNANCETQFPNDNTTWGWRGTNEGNASKSCRQVSSPLGGECTTSEHPRWNSNSTNYGTDDFGFSALPAGRRSTSGYFSDVGSKGRWWSSTGYSSNLAWARGLSNGGSPVYRGYGYKDIGFSIRCVRNDIRTEND